jgi:galactosyl transferase GMA12/MNN10 family
VSPYAHGVRPRRKVICTIAAGDFAPLLEIARPSLEAYAARHEWELVLRHDGDARGRPLAWAKIPLIADLLGRYDLVTWLDADAIIVDGSRDLASELRWRRDLYLVEHHERTSSQVTANTGVFMLRTGDWAKRLLEAVWAQEDLIEHIWWENAAMMRLLGYRIDSPREAGRERRTPWLRRVRFLDVAWNDMAHFHHSSPAPRIKHFGGLPLDIRATAMAEAAARAH